MRTGFELMWCFYLILFNINAEEASLPRIQLRICFNFYLKARKCTENLLVVELSVNTVRLLSDTDFPRTGRVANKTGKIK